MSSLATIKEKVAETVQSYWRLAELSPPSAQELAAWFDTLEPASQTQLVRMGLAKVPQLGVFKRYVLEQRGFSMRNYMQAYLTSEELPYWIDDNDGGVAPG